MANFTAKNGRKSPLRAQGSGKMQTIMTKDTPFSYVEAFKTLRTNLEFVASVNNAKCIMITSALPAESKSTTALNLALALAGNGHSVALVECDLRKPVLRRALKADRVMVEGDMKGLSSYLAGEASLGECLYRVKKYDISVVVAGAIPPNPSELLNHERMQHMVKALKEGFDFVILDAPPITVVTDAAVLGKVADGAVLVVRSKYASAKSVRLAKQRLDAVNTKILGTVITRFDVKKAGWGSGYNYESYEYGYGQPRSKK